MIEEAILKLGTATAVARYLGVTSGFVYQVRDGKRALPDLHAGRLAELLGKDPATAVWENLERKAGSEAERVMVRKWAKSALSAGLSVFLIFAAGLITATESVNYRCNLMNAGFNYRSLMGRILSLYFQVFPNLAGAGASRRTVAIGA